MITTASNHKLTSMNSNWSIGTLCTIHCFDTEGVCCSVVCFQVNFPMCTIASMPRLPEHCIEYVRILQWPKEKPFGGSTYLWHMLRFLLYFLYIDHVKQFRKPSKYSL